MGPWFHFGSIARFPLPVVVVFTRYGLHGNSIGRRHIDARGYNFLERCDRSRDGPRTPLLGSQLSQTPFCRTSHRCVGYITIITTFPGDSWGSHYVLSFFTASLLNWAEGRTSRCYCHWSLSQITRFYAGSTPWAYCSVCLVRAYSAVQFGDVIS